MDNLTAYLAGFVDGEGSIAIGKTYSAAAKKTGNKARVWYLRVSCHQLNPQPLHLLQERFGGSVRQHGYSKDKAGKRQIFEWVACSKIAASAIKTLRPMLIVKADEADLALEFQELKRNRSAVRGKREPLSEDEQAVRELMYQRMRDLKQRKYGQDREAATT